MQVEKLSDKPKMRIQFACGSILLNPAVIEGKFYKGILLVSNPEDCMRSYPDIKKYFILVSETTWTGWSHTQIEDIYALPIAYQVGSFLREFPDGKYVVLNGADFCNANVFHPIKAEKDYDIIFISRAAPFKRHELLIKVLCLLKKRYNRNIKTVAIVMFPKKPIKFANFFKNPLNLRQTVRNVRQELYPHFIKFLYKKAVRDGLNVNLITNRLSHRDLSVTTFNQQVQR